jgi:hypothetical protein
MSFRRAKGGLALGARRKLIHDKSGRYTCRISFLTCPAPLPTLQVRNDILGQAKRLTGSVSLSLYLYIIATINFLVAEVAFPVLAVPEVVAVCPGRAYHGRRPLYPYLLPHQGAGCRDGRLHI